MIRLSDNDKKYFGELWEKIDKKMKKVASRSFDKIPYTAELGVHDDKGIRNLDWWTNGFWGGMMWILYLQTGDEQYKNTAINAENKLRKVLWENAISLHHDVGFMWNITSGVHYRIDGDKAAMNDELLSAFSLASRFNLKGGYIRAWNPEQSEEENKGWAIIDCMMNVPLLYRASKIAGDDRFIHIAKAHADKTMENHIRPDGSVKHIVEYNPENGEFVKEYGGQGYGEGSSWSRGQAWALYGFVLSYIHSGDKKYLDTAKMVANYFISCLSNEKDFLPLCDFRAPKEPVIYDSTAGCCAACGLIELANCVDEYEKDLYLDAAIKLLKATTDHFVDFNEEKDPLVLYGTERYTKGIHIPIIYGDYFYIEAIYKLINQKETDMLMW